jgi:hypothetical protein
MENRFLRETSLQQQQQNKGGHPPVNPNVNPDVNCDGKLDNPPKGRMLDANFDGKVDEPYRTMIDHAHILADAYRRFLSDGKLTGKEITTLEKLGTVLDGADIKVDRRTGDATITESDGLMSGTLTFASRGEKQLSPKSPMK